MSEALVIDGVHKSFGALEVLRGVDLVVAEHEVVCLIGASGSGKSTLLRCVNLLEPIDQGRIVVEGEEITAPGVNVNRIRRRIGIVFQAYNLFPHMSVLRNVTLAPTLALRVPRARARAAPRARLHSRRCGGDDQGRTPRRPPRAARRRTRRVESGRARRAGRALPAPARHAPAAPARTPRRARPVPRPRRSPPRPAAPPGGGTPRRRRAPGPPRRSARRTRGA